MRAPTYDGKNGRRVFSASSRSPHDRKIYLPVTVIEVIDLGHDECFQWITNVVLEDTVKINEARAGFNLFFNRGVRVIQGINELFTDALNGAIRCLRDSIRLNMVVCVRVRVCIHRSRTRAYIDTRKPARIDFTGHGTTFFLNDGDGRASACRRRAGRRRP